MAETAPAAALRTPIPATELSPQSDHRIVLFGRAGTGKTMQIRTLPKPIFVVTFEGSALTTLCGAKDIMVLPFFPRRPCDGGSIAATSIRKAGQVAFDALAGTSMINRDFGRLYSEFANDMMARMEQDWWRREGFMTLALDGLSTMARHLLSRTRVQQDKVKSDDGRTDYTMAGNTTTQVFSYLSQQTPVFFTALHYGTKIDEGTKRTYQRMELPGGSRDILPTVATVCWRTYLAKDENQKPPATRYCAQTFPDREFDWIRPGSSTVPDHIDLTIDDWSRPEEYGIGKLIKQGTLTPTTAKK